MNSALTVVGFAIKMTLQTSNHPTPSTELNRSLRESPGEHLLIPTEHSIWKQQPKGQQQQHEQQQQQPKQQQQEANKNKLKLYQAQV